MDRVARALDFFSMGILRPRDIVEWNRRYYSNPAIVSSWSRACEIGLHPEEAALVDRFFPQPGTALVLGCGGGREAIALAKRGWEVVAMDNSPNLLAAARNNAVEAGVQVEWRCQDLSQGIPLDCSFDLICLFGQLYTLIPGRKRRVELLKACRNVLEPEGVSLVTFNTCVPPSRKEIRAHRCRKALAWLVRGNGEIELSDRCFYGQAFHHFFSSRAEIIEEAATADLGVVAIEMELASRQGAAVLKRVSQPAQVVGV